MSETPLYPRNWRRGARIGSGGSSPTSGSNLSVNAHVVIIALLPNPSGLDQGNETIILGNQSTSSRTLTGWKLVDDDGGRADLDNVTIPAGGSFTVELGTGLSLGNGGDKVTLEAPSGFPVQTVTYGAAANGRFVTP